MSVFLNASSFAGPESSFTIPYDTLRAVSTDLVDVREGLDRMRVQMVSALLSTVFMGMHTACAAYAVKIQISRGLTRSRKALLCATTAMYAATLASWVALLVSQFRSLSALKTSLIETSSSLPPADCFVQQPAEDLPGYCTTLPAARPPTPVGWDSAQGCVGTAALTFNVVLGDAIVWWRVWVLWGERRAVLVACCLVLFATLLFGSLDSAVSCAAGGVLRGADPLSRASNRVAAGGAFFEGNFFGLCAVCVSLASNAAATLLVGYKALKHRLRATKYFAEAHAQGVGRAQRVLMLLVESGVAYCLLWALVLSSNASWVLSSPGLSAWSNIMLYFAEGCIVALVGIYPTLIIVLVALDKSEIAKHSDAALAWWSLSVPSVACRPGPADVRSERDIDMRLRPACSRSPTQSDTPASDGSDSGSDSDSDAASAMSSPASESAVLMGTNVASPASSPVPRTPSADGWT